MSVYDRIDVRGNMLGIQWVSFYLYNENGYVTHIDSQFSQPIQEV